MPNTVQISLVTQLSETSNKFQEQHRKYAMEVKRQKDRTRKLVTGRTAEDEAYERREEMLRQYVDQGFSQEQIDALMVNEQMVAERDVELQNIYTNIVDLHTMFKDLNQLVIDQGTLLDRIDHNVEETKAQFQKANRELMKTANMAKKSKFVLIVMCLMVLIILMVLALVVKALW